MFLFNKLNLKLKSTATIAVSRPDNKQNCRLTGKECECVEKLASGVMGFASASLSESVVALLSSNTKFKPLFLRTHAGIPYTNTHKHRISYFKSTHTVLGPAKCWKSISADQQKWEILAISSSESTVVLSM